MSRNRLKGPLGNQLHVHTHFVVMNMPEYKTQNLPLKQGRGEKRNSEGGEVGNTGALAERIEEGRERALAGGMMDFPFSIFFFV